MRKKIVTIACIALMGQVLTGCKNRAGEAKTGEPETAMTTEQAAENYVAAISESTIEWQGYKPTGDHKGTIKIASGDFKVTDGIISGGSFVIDMNSIEEIEDNQRLIGHLKSADFFEVETYPTATFEITGVEDKDNQTLLSGNLTLKDATNNVTFPVSISNEAGVLSVSSEVFTIDRSKWNVRYGSKTFFDDLKDKFINDDIELKISVKANKS
jgi:polyisoprenoid-binding protein YceI